MKKLHIILFSLFLALSVSAQIETPRPSPTATLIQEIGLTEVQIVYSRPGMKDRAIFGELVPYGEMWRTGANASTKINFEDDVSINGQVVPKGMYALYTIPGKEEWTVIIHKNITHGGTGGDNYKTEEDLMRFTVKPVTLKDKVETFTIDLENNQMDRSDLYMAWENTKVSFEIVAPVDEKIVKMIDQTLNPGGTPYYRAASYYHERGNDLEKALNYADAAIKKYDEGGVKAYWAARTKALILADMGNYKEAIKAAQMSTEWAKAEKNNSYVLMNDKSIEEWKKK